MQKSTRSLVPFARPDNQRYALTREAPPDAQPPRWWRSRWGIVDTLTSNCEVIEWFWSWGAADHRKRCLNGEAAIGCASSSPQASHAEVWALAS